MAPDISVAAHGVAGADHGTGKIDAVGGAASKGSAVAILPLGCASDSRAGKQYKIVAGCIGVTLDALAPKAAAARHFRGINADKSHAQLATP